MHSCGWHRSRPQSNKKPLRAGKGSYYEGGNAEVTDPAFRTRPGSAVRLGDWKLLEYFEDGTLERYNLRNDIGEKVNLASKQPDKAEDLHALLKAWRKGLKAPVPSQLNPKYKP